MRSKDSFDDPARVTLQTILRQWFTTIAWR